jgi:hypothetical protein
VGVALNSQDHPHPKFASGFAFANFDLPTRGEVGIQSRMDRKKILILQSIGTMDRRNESGDDKSGRRHAAFFPSPLVGEGGRREAAAG